MYKTFSRQIQWLASRVAVIYVVLFLFCITCIDLKTLDSRIKTRHLNDSIPDFSGMIHFSQDQDPISPNDWKSYKYYFGLILRYIPDDIVTRQLLGYVDYYTGHEEEAISLFKQSSMMQGRILFWSNYNLGIIYYKKGMWPQAAGYFLSAIRSNLDLNLLLMQNSLVYKQIFANHYFKYSINDEIHQAQSRAYILLLSSLHRMHQYEKMNLIFKIAMDNKDLSYKDAFYYYGGLSYLGMGQAEKAFLLFQESLNIEKNNPDVYYYIGNIYQNVGELEKARNFLQASYVLHQKNDPRFPYDNHLDLRFF
jgi:tetratricopeptide (TPR) repeat protein